MRNFQRVSHAGLLLTAINDGRLTSNLTLNYVMGDIPAGHGSTTKHQMFAMSDAAGFKWSFLPANTRSRHMSPHKKSQQPKYLAVDTAVKINNSKNNNINILFIK